MTSNLQQIPNRELYLELTCASFLVDHLNEQLELARSRQEQVESELKRRELIP